MLLLRTRLACCSLSMLGRRLGEESAGEGERSGLFSVSKREGAMASRPDQKSRGEGLKKEVGEEFSV